MVVYVNCVCCLSCMVFSRYGWVGLRSAEGLAQCELYLEQEACSVCSGSKHQKRQVVNSNYRLT